MAVDDGFYAIFTLITFQTLDVSHDINLFVVKVKLHLVELFAYLHIRSWLPNLNAK